jgi:hypothetical protein
MHPQKTGLHSVVIKIPKEIKWQTIEPRKKLFKCMGIGSQESNRACVKPQGFAQWPIANQQMHIAMCTLHTT